MGDFRTDFQGEVSKVRYDLAPYLHGKILDLGCGQWKVCQRAVGIDSHGDANLALDVSNLALFADGQWDAVFSSHVLEHMDDWQAALKEWWRLVAIGGHLILYLPHPTLYATAQPGGENIDHKADIYPRDVLGVMAELGGWDLVEEEVRDRDAEIWYEREYSFLHVYRKRDGDEQTYPSRVPRPEKTCAVVRYGGFGDMLVAASVLPALKDEGYHITFYTHTKGREVLEHDPHIDAFVVDKDMVFGADDQLWKFWDRIRTSGKYDRVINLKDSFEDALLSSQGRANHHFWPHAARRNLYGHWSYLEMTHIIADVGFPPRPKFYPSEAEAKAALAMRRKIGEDRFIVVVGLAGSAIHKRLPHLAGGLTMFLADNPDATVVLTGDEHCKALEADFPEHPQIVRTSGLWGVRGSLSFAQVADLVVAPETGILHAVGTESVPKVVFLSHSSATNLAKNWANTLCVAPEDTPCHPCHQLHHGQEFGLCSKHPEIDKAARCAGNISPQMIYDAVAHWYRAKEEAA